MLTAILERGSWIITKLGLPLVYFYHLFIGSIFFNVAAEDAKGFEKLGNYAFVPMQYLFNGKKAIVKDNHTYELTQHFHYENFFFIKTAASSAILPLSFTIGSVFKALAYVSPEVRERDKKIFAAMHSSCTSSNQKYYQSIGLQAEDYRKAERIAPPKWKRHPMAKSRLEKDVLALKEITRILSEEQIPFWINCGSCLGAYQYGGVIPHDWDIDIGILMPDFDNVKHALQKLDPKKYRVQDWSSRDYPKSYLKVFVKESGGMIDFYHFLIDPEKKEIHTFFSNESNIFMPDSWKIREQIYSQPMPFSYVFPLKKALFEGIEVPVPGQIESYLCVFYGTNLAPAKIYNESTGKYEKDKTHPYWQLAEAH